jgi:ABC-type sugar transport system, periplasmic component
MKKISKILSVLLAAVLLCAVFAGCGGGDTKKESSTPAGGDTQPADTDTGDAELDPVTLHFYFFDGKKSATDDVWKKISDYTRDTLNADFDIQFIAGTDYKDKILVKASAGDKWDMNFEGDWVSYFQMVNKDAYMALDDLLPQYAPKLYETYQSTGVLEAAKSKGKIVALPWTMRMTQRPLFQWRGDLAEAAGITVEKDSIKTFDDIDGLLAKLKEAYPDKFTIEVSGIDAMLAQDNLMKVNNHFAIRLDDEELKAVPLETTDAYREMAKFGEKWQSAGYIWKDVLTDQLDHNQLIDQGRLITKFGTYEYARTNRAWVEDEAYWDYSTMYPDSLYANRTPLANCMAIPATAENPERALMFLEQLHSDAKLYDMVHYGVEGETYQLDGEMAVYPEGMDQANSSYMDWGGRWALWDPQFMRPDAGFGPNFWIEEAAFVDSSDKNVISPLEGFNFDTESVKTEMAQLQQIYDDAHKMIEVGMAGEYNAAVDKLIADRQAAGVDKVLAELQKQIDEFIASR